jgi:phosphate:Na+ symporter
MHFLIHILQILGSIALFIFSIKFLSDNLHAISGGNFKRILNQMTAKTSSAILTGTLFTVTLQSSSASSALILSFINTGLINLKKAFGLILGANIGTTITLLFIYFGLKFDVLAIALPILFISFPFYLSRKRNIRKIGGILIAFSLLYIAIYFLKTYLPSLNHDFINQIIYDLKYYGFFTKLLFIIIGIVLTLAIHFSAASITIAILLAEKGLPIELAAMLILGANIGTTFATHLVAAIGNYQTKIVASFHTIFNISCAIFFFFFVTYILNLINLITDNTSLSLITFDILTNILGVIIFIPFVNHIVKYCELKFNQNTSTNRFNTHFFTIPFGSNSEIYRHETDKKLIKLAGTSKQIIHTLGRMITESDDEKMTVFRERIHLLEKNGDDLETEVKDFLNEITQLDSLNDNSFEIHRLIMLCHHLENIGDIAIKIASVHRKRRATNSYFTPKMRDFLVLLQNNLEQGITIFNQNLNNQFEVSIREAEEIERLINTTFKEAENNLMRTIEKDKLTTLSALYYKDLIQYYEQLGDLLFRANKTIVKLNEQ